MGNAIKILVLYDGIKVPQAHIYAEAHNVNAIDLRACRRYKEVTPGCHDYTHIYVAVKDDSFDDIIQNYSEFPITRLPYVPDYRGNKAKEINAWLNSKGYAIGQDIHELPSERKAKAEARAQEAAKAEAEAQPAPPVVPEPPPVVKSEPPVAPAVKPAPETTTPAPTKKPVKRVVSIPKKVK